ncbi:hypothetical protein H2200_000029 [Cladophialophora chaetospira]|uniref:Uncharacterized protein n=1 Tax=Cladophialophora chaetospira TaxID=386627 RepID=A0AA38XNI8_9EURO|nr:hypothetical protein H2200_000029 [Cladophialophora chaetospira]
MSPSSATGRDRTPPKDRKISAKDRSLLTNDSTTAAASVETRSASAKPVWRKLSNDAKYNYTWTDAELKASIEEDHSWLSSDPVTAEKWKNRLLVTPTPTRSFAMYKKWTSWRDHGMATRPRGTGMTAPNHRRYQPPRYSLRSGAK